MSVKDNNDFLLISLKTVGNFEIFHDLGDFREIISAEKNPTNVYYN